MAAKPLHARLALDDFEHAEEFATALAEFGVAVDARGEAAVVVTDGEPLDERTPHVLVGRHGRAEGRNVAAVLPAGATPELVAAAALLAAEGFVVSRANGTAPEPGIHALSAREREVLALLAEGAPNKVIARRLDISVHTAKFHVAAIIAKLGAANRTEAIGIAMREGLVLV
jgi:DNA-binding CsgD family transcriptional regulator